MLIDSYNEGWLDQLDQQISELSGDAQLFLLIDGVFIPGLYRSFLSAGEVGACALLFEELPGCNDETRDVSPFLVLYRGSTTKLRRILGRCSGWPMISAIVTTESLTDLTQRLAAWCVVEVDQQRFNFRFPDTRRLPAIFQVLTESQRAVCRPGPPMELHRARWQLGISRSAKIGKRGRGYARPQ